MNDRAGGLTGAFRAGILLNVVLICALGTAVAVGAVVIVRRLAWTTDLRFDLTRDARYTIGEAEKALVRSITAPVECVYCWGYDEEILLRVLDTANQPRDDLLDRYYHPILDEARARISRVLEEWSKLSPHVKVRIVHNRRSPREVELIAAELGRNPEDVINRVILSQGKRRREVPLRRMMEDMQWGMFPAVPGAQALAPGTPAGWHVHGELATALKALLSGDPVRVAVPRGRDSIVEPGNGNYAGLSALLGAEGYDLEPIDLGKVEKVPEGVGIVLVAGAQKRFEGRDLDVLRRFDDEGGRFLIVADPRFPEDYRPLLEPYGASLLSGMVEDRKHQHPNRRGPADLQSKDLCAGRHAIDAPLKGRVEIYAGPCRALRIERDKAPGAERTALFEASDGADLVPVEFDPQTGDWKPQPGARRRLAQGEGMSERALAAALRRPGARRGTEARIVVVGGTSLISFQELMLATHFGNRDFLINALSWLGGRDATIGVSPRDETEYRTVPLGSVDRPFFWIAIVGLPGLAALAGVLMRFARRN